MAYIGKTPVVGNFQICDAISVVNGQAAYTLQVGSANVIPQSANHMIVSLNGVIQKPGSSFTVSGSTMTFASNLATGDSIDFVQILGNVLDIGAPSDATVTTAKLGDGSVTTAKLGNSAVDLTSKVTGALPVSNGGTNLTSGFKNGFTGMADQWRLTSNFSSDNNPITANLERNDSTGFNYLGSGMSQSSGIFTFPETGYYLVSFHTEHFINGVDREINGRIGVTTNNSSYSDVARGATFVNGVSANTHTSTDCSTIVDVTDTSNVKVRFGVVTDQSGTTTISDTNANVTFMTFIRLGDT